ncbi:MAG: DNA cytosine methyltransferase [Dehalococcoidia bacterium]|nr:DNA cytosine methyltransferase [Dehalococcoidia bacterium]
MRANGSPEPFPRPRVAEFFAGIGLVRKGVEAAGFVVVFANDIEPVKRQLYGENFPLDDFRLGDVTDPSVVTGDAIPDIEAATASFPCTDLSLAGNRAGLVGSQSGAFWGFIRVLTEMGSRRPMTVMLENVPSLATSHGGRDLAAVLSALNGLGYICDILVLDARWFVPQSRPRMFIVGSQDRLTAPSFWGASAIRPSWVERFVLTHPELDLQAAALRPPIPKHHDLASCIAPLPADDRRWWDETRLKNFVGSLSVLQSERLKQLQSADSPRWATAYRRTRAGVATWEIRSDNLSGCLRTARGGSSKQAVVEAGEGAVRVRWMTSREYAALQGAPDLVIESVSENQALFGLGDAVCVPAVEWLAREYLRPLVEGRLTGRTALAYA